MENNDKGESSCKKHSHDSTSNGRPLKKAKFPWQVKGKYHLKDQDETMDEDPVQEDELSSSQNESNEVEAAEQFTVDEKLFDNKVEENLEMLGDYLLKKDFGSIGTLLFGPEKKQSKTTLESSSTSTNQSASTTYPEYTPSYKRVPNSNNNNDDSSSLSSINSETSDSNDDVDNNEATSTGTFMSPQFTKLDEQHLKRWQARQLAKGYVDNTINRVLDSWFFSPLLPYLDENQQPFLDENTQLRLDVTDLFDDFAGDEVIENEGILMAISAHGLQNNQDDSRNINIRRHIPPEIRVFYNRNQLYINGNDEQQNSSNSNVTSQPSSNSSTERNLPNVETTSNTQNEVDNNSNLNDSSSCEHSHSNTPREPPAWRHLSDTCNCPNLHRRVNSSNVPNIPFHRRNYLSTASHVNVDSTLDEPMVSSSEMSNENNPPVKQDKPSSGNSNNNECLSSSDSIQDNYPVSSQNNEQFEENFDFIDAAVSYAIQAKGLIPY